MEEKANAQAEVQEKKDETEFQINRFVHPTRLEAEGAELRDAKGLDTGTSC